MSSYIAYLQQVVSWLGGHPGWAGLIIAAITCVEALAFVGVLVPGVTPTRGAGALVGIGVLGFWSTFAWAVAGAIIGDGVSFWIGHRDRDRLRSIRLLRERPALLERGETFFHRHGGKSVLLARFVGPVRPVVPVVAGMLGMAPARFYFYNLLSALAWAPAHLLPGMAFGMSLALAGEVAGALRCCCGVLALFAWPTLWLARALYRALHLPRGLTPRVLVLLAGVWFSRRARGRGERRSPRLRGPVAAATPAAFPHPPGRPRDGRAHRAG